MAPPIGSANAMTHGIRRFLTTGKLPPGCTYIRRAVNALRDQLEDEVSLRAGGKVGVYQAAVIQSAGRHEIRAQLLQRWLRDNPTLPLTERISLLTSIAQATDARDRCLERLGLHVVHRDDPWGAAFVPNTADQADTPEIHAERARPGDVDPQDDTTVVPEPDAPEPRTLEVLP